MKKIFLAIILLAACANYSSAQLLGSIKVQPSDMEGLSNVKNSAVSKIIEKTVRSGMFVVKRSFQLQDKKSKDLFGLNGRQEFGIGYSVGVKTPQGFCVTNQAMSPWAYNNSFKKYEGKYLPVISKSDCWELDKDSVSMDIGELANRHITLCDSAIYQYTSDLFHEQSFKIDTLTGKKRGWIVLLTHKNKELNNVSDIDFLCQEKELSAYDTICNDSLGNLPLDVTILGGIYITPVFRGIGKLEFHLCGILSKMGNQWKLYFPFLKKESRNNLPMAEKTAIDQERKDMLTPVEKESKSKKRKKS